MSTSELVSRLTGRWAAASRAGGARAFVWGPGVPLLALILAASAIAGLHRDRMLPAGEPATARSPGGSEPALAESAPATAPAARPATLAGFSDEGVFRIYVNEEALVTIEFKWQTDGAFDNATTIEYAGQTIRHSFQITPDREGVFRRIDGQTPLGPVTIEREGGIVRRTARGETVTIEMKPAAVLWDNYAPALVTQAVLSYDEAAGGVQPVPLFILSAMVMDATLERLDRVTRAVGGRDVEFMRYRYGLPGVDVIVWLDAARKVCLVDVPAQHAQYVREGYEVLRKAEVADPLLSQPAHEVTEERGIMVPMRDGVALATDIYRPAGDGKYPVILVRTPYKKEMNELQGRYYARRGYAYAVQDCRGRFGSEGTWEPFVHEPRDGYDTIEWLAGRPWSTGKVGMIGGSYLGWVQWWAASESPPHLVTIIPNVSPPDPLYNIPYEYGTFFLLGAIWWADVLESEATADLSGAAILKTVDRRFAKVLRSLPVIELDKAILEKENPYWRKWIQHPPEGEYWTPVNFSERLAAVRIPVFHQSGWFDGDGIGSKLNYAKMRSCGHSYQKLVLGPWGHTDAATRRIGERDFGEAAIIDLQTQYLRWLDHWLKGVDNGIEREPLVRIFIMGANEWRHGDEYPLPQTRAAKLYLRSGGGANTSGGDGRLSFEPPGQEPPDKYTYDPGDPTPSPEYYEPPENASSDAKSMEKVKEAREAHPARVVAERPDILVYTTEPLAEPVTIAGPVSGVLYASSSAKDTDWFVRLVEVDEAGKAFQLVEGRLRARYRQGMKTPEPLEPGRVYEFNIDMWQTGIRVPAGRRLQVQVASASFPFFGRNLNTGGHNELETEFVPADQTVYHDAERASHIVLRIED